MATAVNHTPASSRRLVSASCVAVSGRSVPRRRCRSTACLKARLITRVSAMEIATSTATVMRWRGCRSLMKALRNDGFCGSREGTTAPEG
jgi:hypothetical protein